MAIRKKDLTAYSDPIRLLDNETTDLRVVGRAIKHCAEEFGAEIVVYVEEAEGGFFDFDNIPCLQICHPNHEKDYYNICLTRRTQGKTCVFQVFTYGKSRQMNLEDFQSNTHVFDGSGVNGVAVGTLRGGALGAGFAIGSAAAGIVKSGGKLLAKGIVGLMRDDAALSVEREWYDLILESIQSVFVGL